MPAVTLTLDDLTDFADIPAGKAQKMIDSAVARAARVAPCILDDTLSVSNGEAAKGVIRDAILRWHDSGSGALSQRSQQAGAFGLQESYDTRQRRQSLFWPAEIEELEAICRDHTGAETSGVFSIDTAPGLYGHHADWCAINFGANYCDCGADIAGYPIFGQPA